MGKFYEMINDFHDSSKKWDPITHYTLDATHDLSTKSVGEMGRAFGWDHLTDMANKDKADFGRWGGNTALSAAAIYGGMSGYEGLAGGGGEAAWVPSGGEGSMMTLEGEGAGTVAQTGLAEPSAAGGGGWMDQVMNAMGGGSGGSGGQGGGGGGSAAQPQQPAATGYGQGTNGNPALSEALARLVSEQEQTKRAQSSPFAAAMNSPQYQPTQAPSSFSKFLQESQRYQNGNQYGRTY